MDGRRAVSYTHLLAKVDGAGRGGLFYTGNWAQLGAQAVAVVSIFATVFCLSFGLFWMIKKTVGLRVSERDEIEGCLLYTSRCV